MKKFKKRILITGKFNILHYGHFQLLEFAKGLNSDLYIGLIDESKKEIIASNESRKKNLQKIDFIKEIVTFTNLEDLFIKIKPDIVLKGSEHKDKKNKEKELIKKYGGSLYFASGSNLKTTLEKNTDLLHHKTHQDSLNNYINKHSINLNKLIKIIDNFEKFKVIVIGDTIIDKYINCRLIGMSQEDKHLISSQISSPQTEIGGAAFIAKNFSALCRETKFISILGRGESELIKNFSTETSLKTYFINDNSRKNTIKTRFLNDSNVIFRINEFDNHIIDNEICKKIEKIVDDNADNFDAIVCADYNYGCINISSVNKIFKKYRKQKFISVDCQISSQLGDITKFNNIDLMTPTEHELRSSMSDNKSSILTLIDNFIKENNIKNLVLTLGSEGVLIPKVKNNETFLHSLPAFNKSPLSVSGAGDVFLTFATLSLLQKNCNIFEASLISSIAASVKTSYIEKKPVLKEEVKKIISGLL